MNWQVIMGFLAAVSATSMDSACDSGGGTQNTVDSGADAVADTAGDQATPDIVADAEHDADGTGSGTAPACYTARTGTSFQPEPTGADQEYSDCIDGCDHGLPVTLIDLEHFSADGLRGQIDGNSHRYSQQGVDNGPDLDLIGLTGPPRTMVEVIVEPYSDSSLVDPVVTGHDGFFPVTFSSDMAPGFKPARIVFATPYLQGLPFYIAIEDAINYERFGQPGATYVGGDGYDYVVRLRTFDFAPTELGTLGPDNSTATVASATLGCPGDMTYYRFYAPVGAAPTVQFTRTGNAAMLGVLAGFNTVGGQLKWVQIHDDARDDNPNDGQVTLPPAAFQPCTDCPSAGQSEFIFSVSEWNGAAGDDYTYSLNVSLAQ